MSGKYSYIYEISYSQLLFRKVAILNIEELPLLSLFSCDLTAAFKYSCFVVKFPHI